MHRVKKILNQLNTDVSFSIEKTSINTPFDHETLSGPSNTKYGGYLVAKTIKEHGVSTIFTLTGGHIAPILVGCNHVGIKVIDVRDEVTTIFAADACSRITGIPHVGIVTAGPGLTNTITAVKNAQMAESPLIIMGGATSMLLKGRGSLQDIDQFALMKPHCKLCVSIKNVGEIIKVVRNAFYVARTGVPGPVFIEFPLETIWGKEFVDLMGDNKKPELKYTINGIKKYLTYYYTKRHFDNVFYKAFEDNSPPIKYDPESFLKGFNTSQLNTIINKLNTSTKPVIVIGSQSLLHPNYVNQLINSLNILNIPIFLSGMGRGLLTEPHKLFIRHKRSYALSNCDILLFCGCAVDFRVGYGRGINPNAYFIMCNLDQSKIDANWDLRRRNCKINKDPMGFLINLGNLVKSKNIKYNYDNWINILRNNNNKRENEIQLMCNKNKPSNITKINNDNNNNDINIELKRWDINYLHPLRCCKIIDKYIDDNCYIIADGGDFVGTASYTIKPKKPLRWLDPGAFGTLGVGAGFALGCKVLNPNKEVWIIYGDGSFGWSISEFDTFKKFNLPVIAIIGNDACWSQMYRDQIKTLKDTTATLLKHSRYDKIVEGFGCKGILVKNEFELEPALIKAKEYAKQGYPVVVNVLLKKSKFREGSISL